ncbi:hypothetical protein BCV70DRAFT_160581 [Testicularia cyperi]|uniref:Uncharacterized protein n=1 Tax=Testicularia cyperi TaxID=1882483 RepID=A0A317XSY9_9BASI|nr:hypothetical protein BCV70DRAFT_160581 [Testicularia cyperi]
MPGWKSFGGSSEQLQSSSQPSVNGDEPKANPIDSTPGSTSTIRSLGPSYSDAYDLSGDNGLSSVGNPLGTIDETSAAGFSSYDRAALPSSPPTSLSRRSGHQSKDRIRIDSAEYEESLYSPSTYPPTSEEDSEAKRVQQNLERWAAEEKMRRKAQRTSKILSTKGPSTAAAGGGLAKRLSSLRVSNYSNGTSSNGLGSGPSSERLADGPSASPVVSYSPQLGRKADGLDSRRGSGSSLGGTGRNYLQRPSSVSSLESGQSYGSQGSDDRPNRRLPPIGTRVDGAGLRHSSHGSNAQEGDKTLGTSASSRMLVGGEARDPFQDPSETGDSTYSSIISRASLKPTPTASRPIVTVGRASSIQRRALEASAITKGKGKARSMPTIVATDTEAEEASSGHGQNGTDAHAANPFASHDDPSHDLGIVASTTLHQGGLDEEVAMDVAGQRRRGESSQTGDVGESSLEDTPKRPAPGRTSTSSSKFRELGITEGDDWIDAMGRGVAPKRSSRMRIDKQSRAAADEHDEPRKPWWTDLLCGCGTSYDDDEQAGRTNPME